jgi:ADP-ribose pyrophosphatase
LDDPVNKNPVPELDDGEFIERLIVPIASLETKLQELHAQGYQIDTKIMHLAQGFSLAQRLKI